MVLHGLKLWLPLCEIEQKQQKLKTKIIYCDFPLFLFFPPKMKMVQNIFLILCSLTARADFLTHLLKVTHAAGFPFMVTLVQIQTREFALKKSSAVTHILLKEETQSFSFCISYPMNARWRTTVSFRDSKSFHCLNPASVGEGGGFGAFAVFTSQLFPFL